MLEVSNSFDSIIRVLISTISMTSKSSLSVFTMLRRILNSSQETLPSAGESVNKTELHGYIHRRKALGMYSDRDVDDMVRNLDPNHGAVSYGPWSSWRRQEFGAAGQMTAVLTAAPQLLFIPLVNVGPDVGHNMPTWSGSGLGSWVSFISLYL